MISYPYVTDYSGRQIDIELLQSIVKPVELQRVNLALVTQTPKIVTGIEKLAQRYALCLLTSLNTVKFDQDFGCELYVNIAQGIIQNQGQLQNIFAVSNAEVVRILREEDALTDIYGDMPDDEQLDSTTLLNADVDVVSSIISLRVQLISLAGVSITFIVPTTVPRS